MTDRETMQAIMQVLGPEAVCVCAGCQWETNEAIRLLQDAGIAYQHRKALAKPPHDPAKEQLGNETTTPPLVSYMTADATPERDAAFLRMYAARVLDRTASSWEIPNTVATTLQDIANRIEGR